MNPFRQRSTTRRWSSLPMAIALIVVSMLIPASSMAGHEPKDMVLEWNINAVSTISNPLTGTPPGLGQPPPLSPIHIAMVHGAIYDAVMAIVRTHEPYLHGLHARRSASQAAAVAAAGYGVLDGLVPTTPEMAPVKASVLAMYTASLAKIRDGKAKERGIKVGAAAAAAMLADRVGDGRFGTTTFDASGRAWRVAPRAAAQRQFLPLGERGQAIHVAESGPVPHRAAVPARQRPVRQGVQRGQVARWEDLDPDA